MARRPITSARKDPGVTPNLVAPQVAIAGGVNELVQAGEAVANTLDFFYQKIQKEENNGFNDELEARYGIAADEIVRGSRGKTLNKDYAQNLTTDLQGMRSGLIEELRQKYRVNGDGMNLANRNTVKKIAASTRSAATRAFNSRLSFHAAQNAEKLQNIFKDSAKGGNIEINMKAVETVSGSSMRSPAANRKRLNAARSEIVEQSVEHLVRTGDFAGARAVREKYDEHIDIDKWENLENTIRAGEKRALTAGIKQRKDEHESIFPTEDANKTNPVKVFSKVDPDVQRNSQRFNNALAGGQEDDDDATTDVKEELRLAVDVAGDSLLEAQAKQNISPAYRKLLDNNVAAAFARRIETVEPDKVFGEMEKLRLSAGKHWPQVWKEMQQQGLSDGMIIAGMAETPEQMRDAALATRLKMKDIGATLPTGDIKDVKDAMMTEMQPFFTTFARGGVNGPQVRSFAEGLQKLAIHHLANGSTQEEAVKKAAAMINDQFHFVEGPQISVMLPKETKISPAELEDVLDHFTTPEELEKFNPLRMQKDVMGSLEQHEVISNAMAFGVWRSNAENDGVILMNRLQGGTLNVIRDEDGNYFGLKYVDIPLLVRDLEVGIQGDS